MADAGGNWVISFVERHLFGDLASFVFSVMTAAILALSASVSFNDTGIEYLREPMMEFINSQRPELKEELTSIKELIFASVVIVLCSMQFLALRWAMDFIAYYLLAPFGGIFMLPLSRLIIRRLTRYSMLRRGPVELDYIIDWFKNRVDSLTTERNKPMVQRMTLQLEKVASLYKSVHNHDIKQKMRILSKTKGMVSAYTKDIDRTMVKSKEIRSTSAFTEKERTKIHDCLEIKKSRKCAGAQGFDANIPIHLQRLEYAARTSWLWLSVCLFWSMITAIAAWISGEGFMRLAMLGSNCFVVGSLISYNLWYRSLYQTFRSGDALRYPWFIIYVIHILFCAACILTMGVLVGARSDMMILYIVGYFLFILELVLSICVLWRVWMHSKEGDTGEA